jgi:mannose-6-phosphate isomerase-like protein (cupin superfamily)
MSESAKGPAIVLGPEDGESFWQPNPSTGYIISKITPYTSPFDTFSTGIQVLEPGAAVREHGHERSHELLFVYEGTGHALVDGERHALEPGSMMLMGRRVLHYVQNDGDTQMKILWVIFPPGLEDWFRAIGRPRQPGETEAPVFDRPDDVEDIQNRQRFVRPGE